MRFLDRISTVQKLFRLTTAEKDARQQIAYINYAPVDVSIALLLDAGKAARGALLHTQDQAASRSVLPFCADFEEGPLAFAQRLRESIQYPASGASWRQDPDAWRS